MNIGITVSPSYPVPPHEGYGGTQRGAYELSIGLAERGHNVFLAASGDSHIDHPNVELIPVVERAIFRDGPVDPDAAKAKQAAAENTAVDAFSELSQNGELDIVNVRWERPRTVANLGKLGINHVLSISCNFSEPDRYQLLGARSEFTSSVTAHTVAHKQALGGSDAIEVAPYGINTSAVPFSRLTLPQDGSEPTLSVLEKLKSMDSDYLLHLATILPYKGQATSIEIAKRAGIPLVLAGSPSDMQPEVGRSYFASHIEPHIDNESVFYFGNANEQQKYELMKYARATLFCSGVEVPSFSEPFGRVIAESLATGTPVVGYNYGSFPELVPENVGVRFNTVDEAVHGIANIADIDRTACRAHADENLSTARFIDSMEAILLRSIVDEKAA